VKKAEKAGVRKVSGFGGGKKRMEGDKMTRWSGDVSGPRRCCGGSGRLLGRQRGGKENLLQHFLLLQKIDQI
jgi:hypothetical protein